MASSESAPKMETTSSGWGLVDYVRDHQTSLIIASLFAYVTHYLIFVARKPKLIHRADYPLASIVQKLPSVNRFYLPPIWGYSAHATTIFRVLLSGSPETDFKEELFDLPDGGVVKLDWLDPVDAKQREVGPERPIVVVLPGITGSSKENYVRRLALQASQAGFRSVVLNARGLGGVDLRTARICCSTHTADLDIVARSIASRWPEAPMMAVGCSMGGMVLTHYLAAGCRGLTVGIEGSEIKFDGNNNNDNDDDDNDPACPFVAAMTISCVFNTFDSSASLEEPLNWLLYNWALKSTLIQIAEQNRDVLKSKVDFDRVIKAKTIREYDAVMTSKVMGYPDNESYYASAVLTEKISAISGCPLLCLSAADDPFSPGRSVPEAEIASSSHVALVLTQRGGHLGFLDGLWPRGPNLADKLFGEFAQAVFAAQEMK